MQTGDLEVFMQMSAAHRGGRGGEKPRGETCVAPTPCSRHRSVAMVTSRELARLAWHLMGL